MNTTSNKGRGAAYAVWAAGFLGLCVLALAGCSDHGPVGIYSPELFNKNVGSPQLAYYAYTVNNMYESGVITFTANTTPENANIEPLVVIVNAGGSGTYAPVQATFSCPSDPNLVFEAGNYSGTWNSSAGNATPTDPATAVSTQGAGNEILGFSQTQIALYWGYYNSNGGAEVTPYPLEYSFNAYYIPNSDSGHTANVAFSDLINLTLKDGFGVMYTTSFDIGLIETTQ